MRRAHFDGALFEDEHAAAAFLAHWPRRSFWSQAGARTMQRFSDAASWGADPLIRRHTGLIKSVDYSTSGIGEQFVSPARALDLHRTRTLCLIDFESCSDDVSRLLDACAAFLRVERQRCNCNVYLSPLDEGTPLHFDDHEVIVIQLQGNKVWSVADNSEVELPTANYVVGEAPAGQLALYYSGSGHDFRPTNATTVTMEPGSVLFLPRGTWHATRATGASVSLSIGVYLSSALETIQRMLAAELVSDKRFRKLVLEPAELGQLWLLARQLGIAARTLADDMTS